MRLIYATSIAFSNKMANRVQVHSMSKQFQKQLKDDFYLGVNYKNVDDKTINIICFNTNKSYKLAWRYSKFIKNKNINYVYCREARLLFFIILFNKLFFHRKLNFAFEIHAIDEKIINKIVEKFLSFWVNKFIFITQNLCDIYLNKIKIKKDKTIIAPDGVDLEIFDLDISREEARKKLDLPIGKKIIGYSGKFKTMGMDKGIDDILKAVKILKDKKILFAAIGGSDKEVDYYKKRAEEEGVVEQVILKGLSPQNVLAIHQKAFDVLLMPFPYNQHYAFYMSPLKMFEYMAGKRPIIATDLPSVKEVLNVRNAIIVKPDDPEGLATGIKKALEDEDLVNKIANQAFQDVGQYAWGRRVEKILGFIK